MRVPHSVLRQRMVVEDYLGEGSRGPTFGPARGPIHASVQHTAAVTVDWKDEEIIVTTLVIVRPEDGPVPAGSKVTVDGKVYRVVKGFAMPDEFRPTHWELMVKSWGFEA